MADDANHDHIHGPIRQARHSHQREAHSILTAAR
jgi:hypothetical protein